MIWNKWMNFVINIHQSAWTNKNLDEFAPQYFFGEKNSGLFLSAVLFSCMFKGWFWHFWLSMQVRLLLFVRGKIQSKVFLLYGCNNSWATLSSNGYDTMSNFFYFFLVLKTMLVKTYIHDLAQAYLLLSFALWRKKNI